MKFEGRFKVVHKDKTGQIKGVYYLKNGVTNVGKDRILATMFNGTALSSPWYIGLIDNAGFVGLSAADTIALRAGWTEFVNYDGDVRQTWDEAAVSGQEIVTTTPATFTISSDGSEIIGLFIVDDDTKGGTVTGTLWSTGLFDAVKTLDDDDTLDVQYEISVS